MTKINQLNAEEKKLNARLGWLEKELQANRGAILADPLHVGEQTAARIAQLQIQIDAIRERTAQVIAEREAEEARVNSPEVKRNIKQAEKTISEISAFCKESTKTLLAMQKTVNDMIAQGNNATNVLKTSGREPGGMMGLLPQYLQHTKQSLDSWQMIGDPVIKNVNARND